MIPNYGFNLYSLMINDFEPLFMCLLIIPISYQATIQAHIFLVGLLSFFMIAFLGVLFVFGI